MKSWTSWEIIRHQVAICGLIKDDRGNLITDAQINIVSMPTAFSNWVSTAFQASEKEWEDLEERVDRAETNNNGIFYFMDLPSGPYTLQVIDGRSGIQDEKKVNVTRDEEGNIDMAMVTVNLSIPHKQ